MLRALGVSVCLVALLLDLVVIANPGYGVTTLILLLAVGLLPIGVTEIAAVWSLLPMVGWLGAFLVVGILDLLFVPIVVHVPTLAVATLIALLSVFLLLNGLSLIASTAVGRICTPRVG